jgi:hypothetical protein
MNTVFRFILLFLSCCTLAGASVRIDVDTLGNTLGGWGKRSGQAAEYPLSGATYRTYKPEVSPTPDGGLFVSLRIDHVRGWLSSDDHAVLEITIDRTGNIASAQSSIAIQGRSVTSDLIRSGTDAGQKAVGVDRAVQIGTDLVADISAKLLREKLVEAGRVSFPAVLRHNYNLLYQAIRTAPVEPPPVKPEPTDPENPAPDAVAVPDPTPAPAPEPIPTPALDIKQFGGTPKGGEIKP